jgi:excisionase family DNA binding protein
MAEKREFFSIPETAALMGVSRIAIFKKVKKGQLAAVRIGRNWAVPAAAIDNPQPPKVGSTNPAHQIAKPTKKPVSQTGYRTEASLSGGPAADKPLDGGVRPPPTAKIPPKEDEMAEMGWD